MGTFRRCVGTRRLLAALLILLCCGGIPQLHVFLNAQPLIHGNLRSAHGSRRLRHSKRHALDPEGAVSFGLFSVVAGAPIPVLFSAAFRRAEVVDEQRAAAAAAAAAAGDVSSQAGGWSFPVSFDLPSVNVPFFGEKADDAQNLQSSRIDDAISAEPRDLMWAFPSFAVFLEDPQATAPDNFPLWARWLCLLTFWPGVVWYLWYKLLVEEDLRQNRDLGIGGYVVIVPFAIGLFAGVYGEVAFGSLEGSAFADPFAAAFYAAFAWIYLNQWFLYNKVNQLFEDEGRLAPLDPYGLFIPGWNFITGIRQIHFLADYWARQRGEVLQKDAFAELFPFVKKPTLSLSELVVTPSLWIDLQRLIA